MNKKLTTALLLSLCITVSSTTEVTAKEPTTIEDNNENKNEELKELAKKYGWKIIKWAEETDKKINEKIVNPATNVISDAASDITLYKHDSLWLITDMPNTNPAEQRHYFFVNKNIPTIKTTTFYDKNGKEVEKNDKTAARKVEKEGYISVSDAYVFFLIETDCDLTTQTFATNFIDLDTEHTWEEDTPFAYGRFTNISDLIPEDMQKEKYTTKDLLEILEVLNNCEYELSGTSLKREIKQN